MRVEAESHARSAAVLGAASLFRSLSDSTRLEILDLLSEHVELRVVDLVGRLGLAQSTVSTHLACLRGCGLIEVRPEGRQSFYRIAIDELSCLLRDAQTVLVATGHAPATCPTYGLDPR